MSESGQPEQPITNYTPRAQQTLLLAQKEAESLNHNFVGTEHILLGLIKLNQGTAVNVLRKSGLDLESIREEIKRHAPAGPGPAVPGNRPYTPRTKQVLAIAAKEAQALGHKWVGTEHLLLGLLRERDGLARRLLIGLGLELKHTRELVLQELDPNRGISGSGPEKVLSQLAVDPMHSLTPRAKQALALARQEAEQLNHNFVGTEHLLLGILRLGQGAAIRVLGKLGIDLERVRTELQKLITPGPDSKIVGHVPYTPRVKKVLALAAEEAKAMSRSAVGTEHLLLGLLREGNGPAQAVLLGLGANLEKTRESVLQEIAQHGAATADQPKSAASTSPPSAAHSSPASGTAGSQALNNFTPRAQTTLARARQEADQLNHNFVGTEHLLLGLIALGQGVAVTVLARLGLDLETVRTEVKRRLGPGFGQKVIGNIPYTPRVKSVLASAAKEARALNHTYIGTEHILLGLLLEDEGIAHDLLSERGINPDRTRELILQELDPNYGAKPSSSKPTPPAAGTNEPARSPEVIDTAKAYDVYCAERDQVVVYRNALFKSRKTLLPRHSSEFLAEFIELQLEDGSRVFVARASILKFCPPGATPKSDASRHEKPQT